MKRISSLFVAVILLVSLCACARSTEEQWQEQYDIGVRYLSEGNYEEAIIAFTAAIEIDPKRTEAYNGLADAYLALGDYESAAAVWTDAQSQTTDQTLLSVFTSNSEKYEEIRAGLESGESGVWITSMIFDQEKLLARKETPFYLTAIYRASSDGPLQMSLSANTEEPQSWKWQTEYENIAAGVGIHRLEVSLIPTLWEEPYFGIRVGLLSASERENGIWNWVADDTWYITPEGQVSYYGTLLNDYGATEFIYRHHYEEFSTLDVSIQSRIETLAEAVISGDQDYLLSLVDTDTGFNGSFYTMWNGYKIEIYDEEEWDYDYDVKAPTDRSKSFQLEMRPENGSGYYCYVGRSETTNTAGKDSWFDWCNSINIVTSSCVDWQWNGTVTVRESYEILHRFLRGTTCHTTETTSASGTMNDGLWDGTATFTSRKITDWSPDGPDDYDETTTTTRFFQGGILLEENGEPWDGREGYHLISDGYRSRIYSNEQSFLDARYW